MKTTQLTWYERISLWNRIGTVNAPTLKEAEVCLRIIAKLRPTDAEARETKLTTTEDGFRWELPSQTYGDKVLELEDGEAEALVRGLETHPHPVRVADAAWMLRVIAQLKLDNSKLNDPVEVFA